MHYLTVDLANTVFRARHIAHRGSSAEEKAAFAIHVALSSISKAWRDQKGDHVVICLEGRSWRKDFYKPYKANRAVAKSARTVVEVEEDTAFFEAFDSLSTFFNESSNCTVLRGSNLEADDLIAGWIQTHPADQHTIISTDTDFYQLLAPNVNQYNGISDELHTIEGIYDAKGKLVIDKKTKEPKAIPEPEWILFEKCMRGDPTDNVFSAYPGVRTKGSKSKIGLLEAYEDRHKKGFAWNNLVMQRWTDHNKVEHKVLDDYHRNVTLIDLKAQPAEIRTAINETIAAAAVTKNIAQVGTKFLRFCGKYELKRVSDNAQNYVGFLSKGYPNDNTQRI